jgi:hypothetical protein
VGIKVEVHDDHFRSDAKDEEWLSEAGRRGWIVLSKDDQIRYHAVEKQALLNAGVAAFFLSRGDLKGMEMADILIKAMHGLIAFSKNTNGHSLQGFPALDKSRCSPLLIDNQFLWAGLLEDRSADASLKTGQSDVHIPISRYVLMRRPPIKPATFSQTCTAMNG